MAKLEFNVASRPFVNHAPLSRTVTALGVILTLATFANVFWLLDALHESRTLSARVTAERATAEEARSETKKLTERLSEREKKRLKAVAASSTAIIEKRRLSWSRLFDQLELVLPRDVRVVRILPDVQGNEMLLLMEAFARDEESLQRFYAKLHEAPFRDAYILGEMVEKDRIRFQVRCRYESLGADADPVREKPMPWEVAALRPAMPALIPGTATAVAPAPLPLPPGATPEATVAPGAPGTRAAVVFFPAASGGATPVAMPIRGGAAAAPAAEPDGESDDDSGGEDETGVTGEAE